MTKNIFFVVVLSACGGATVQAMPDCPVGSSWNGSVCAANIDTSCPAGTSFVSGRGCVATMATPEPVRAAPPPPPAATVEAGGVPKTTWVAYMIANLPPKLCTTPYFQQCFVTSPSACNAAMTRLTRSCLHDADTSLPRMFDSESGRREGTKIGRCVGAAYELELRAEGRFANTADCNDVTKWQ